MERVGNGGQREKYYCGKHIFDTLCFIRGGRYKAVGSITLLFGVFEIFYNKITVYPFFLKKGCVAS